MVEVSKGGGCGYVEGMGVFGAKVGKKERKNQDINACLQHEDSKQRHALGLAQEGGMRWPPPQTRPFPLSITLLTRMRWTKERTTNVGKHEGG